MTISILTLFPEMFHGPFDCSILKRAQEKNLVTIDLVNIRDFASDAYKTVDDHPYGGGTGMIMRVDVIDRAIQRQKVKGKRKKERIILLDPRGTPFTEKKARELSALDHIILICGHYEGVDERVGDFVDERISVGPYVLTGGELPAMIIADSVIRLIPGVLAKADAALNESFSETMKHEHPQYTKPRTYKKLSVPEILLSGDHKKIQVWRKNNALND